MIRTTSALLICLILAISSAAARDEADRRFRELDGDGDGKLTPEELPYPRIFKRADADGDGVITLDEARALRRGRTRRSASDGPEPKATPPLRRHLDIPYAKIEGVDPALLSLDLYAPEAKGKHPVLVMVHGGGWRNGDKSGAGMTRYKVPHFVGSGFLYVSVNYRLSKAPEVVHPTHVEDVAKALAWLHDNAPEYGGDPDRIYLMGHSAGAHLAALVATDHRRLDALGKRLSILRGVVCLDTAAYDVPRYVNELGAGPQMRKLYEIAFGPTEEAWRDASPRHHVAPGKGIPPMLFFHTGSRMAGEQLSNELVAALGAAGVRARAVHAKDRDHAGINWCIGQPGDPYTEAIMEFLGAMAGREEPESGSPGVRPGTPAPLFVGTELAGLTDVEAGTNGFALADLNRDGFLDFVAVQSEPGAALPVGPRGRPVRGTDRLRVLINRRGGRSFEEHPVSIRGGRLSYDDLAPRAQIPNLIDLDGDGLLDIFLSRHAPMTGGKLRRGADVIGNTLLLSDGRWDRFLEVEGALGAANGTAYNRQTAFGDVSGDGRLDLAVGCDNIGDAMGGLPFSRLYVYRPKGGGFAAGRFEDIGGGDRVPDFGGWHDDPAKDKAGPDVQLADLDGDGDLDLLQTCHADIRDPRSRHSPAEYRQGVFCWRNLLAEEGEARFAKVVGNGLAVEGRMRWDEEKRMLVPDGKAPGLPYVALFDSDNDGRLDVLAVGPSDPGWAPRPEPVGGRFWRNLGGMRFEEATAKAGLEALNWTYREWFAFQEIETPPEVERFKPRPYPSQPGRMRLHPLDERPYWADVVVGDFDNDGWQDFVALDRRATSTWRGARAVLFRNTGAGAFEPLPEEVSGIDGKGISGEAADLDNDGLLDLVFAADPDNSGGFLIRGQLDRYRDRVYHNTGARGGRENHWLRIRFAGAPHGALAGARVLARAGERSFLRTVSSAHAYKSGGAMEVHFGLGSIEKVDLTVTLTGGRTVDVPAVAADRYVEIDLARGVARPVRAGGPADAE